MSRKSAPRGRHAGGRPRTLAEGSAPVFVKLSPDVLGRVDRLVGQLGAAVPGGLRLTRSDALRAAIASGLDAIEAKGAELLDDARTAGIAWNALEAARAAARGRGRSVRLVELRAALPGVAREDLDRVLVRLVRAGHLTPTEGVDLGALSAADREAGLSLEGELCFRVKVAKGAPGARRPRSEERAS